MLTFYHALETASISNELDQTDAQQFGRISQVAQTQNATVIDSNDTTNAQNDTATTTTTPPNFPPSNETNVESITMDISSVTTVEVTQNSDSTTAGDNATQNPETTTAQPETTVLTSTEATTVSTEENPNMTPSDLSSPTTLESTEAPMPTDSSTEMSASSEAPVAITARTDTTVETTTVTEASTQSITTSQITTDPPFLGRIVYSANSENATASVNEPTTLMTMTEINSDSTMSTRNIIETTTSNDATDSDNVTTPQSNTEESNLGRILYSEDIENATVMTTSFDGSTTPTLVTGIDSDSTMSTINTIDTTTSNDLTTSDVMTSSPSSTKVPNLGRITDRENIESSTVPTTPVDESTTSIFTTEMSTDSMTSTVTMIDTTLSNDEIRSDSDVVTITQSSTEVPTTTIAATSTNLVADTEVPTTPAENARPEISNVSKDDQLNAEIVMETGTSAPEATTMSMMAETITLSESTEVPTTLPTTAKSMMKPTTMFISTSDEETSTKDSIEIVAQFRDSITTMNSPQTTLDGSTTPTQAPMLIMNSEDAVNNNTNSGPLFDNADSLVRDRNIVEMLGARLSNNTDTSSTFDNSLLSRMMLRLMNILSDSSEQTDSALNKIVQVAQEATIRSDLSVNTTEPSSPPSEDDLPQFLGGFLDNTDKNDTIDGTGGIENGTASEMQPNQTAMTTIMGSNQITLSFKVPSTQATTPAMIPTTQMGPNALEETTLTPSTSGSTDPAPQGDLTSTLATDVTNIMTNQPSETTLTSENTVELLESKVESDQSQSSRVAVGDLESIQVTTGDPGVMTNNMPETTTPISDTSPALTDEIPNSLAGFQDTTTATAQRTAGDDAQANTLPTQTNNSETTPTTDPSPITTESSTTTETSTTTESSTTTETSSIPSMTTVLEISSRDGAEINKPSAPRIMATSTPAVPTDTTPQTTSEPVTETSSITSSTTTVTTASSPMTIMPSSTMTTQTSTMIANDTGPIMNVTSTTSTTTSSTPSTVATTQYLGRFGGTRITPAPRFSVSSSTRTPLRDYLVYGIFPNKTIVRKRPEDNLIDARNVDSPYVIFGIFPDGKLVRKFPNGTVIPDPPTNPVEVVFSLSTTTSTTNRPRPVIIDNQQNNNQAYYYNQNAALYNNRPSSIFDKLGIQLGGFPGQVDLGLTGNSIGPTGDAPNSVASQSTTTTMVFLHLSYFLLSSGPRVRTKHYHSIF